jgi:ribosomal protein L19E
MPNLPNLYRQKRLAMALFGAGQRKVWLDPSKKELIERAKSRECGVQWRAVACD